MGEEQIRTHIIHMWAMSWSTGSRFVFKVWHVTHIPFSVVYLSKHSSGDGLSSRWGTRKNRPDLQLLSGQLPGSLFFFFYPNVFKHTLNSYSLLMTTKIHTHLACVCLLRRCLIFPGAPLELSLNLFFAISYSTLLFPNQLQNLMLCKRTTTVPGARGVFLRP